MEHLLCDLTTHRFQQKLFFYMETNGVIAQKLLDWYAVIKVSMYVLGEINLTVFKLNNNTYFLNYK